MNNVTVYIEYSKNIPFSPYLDLVELFVQAYLIILKNGNLSKNLEIFHLQNLEIFHLQKLEIFSSFAIIGNAADAFAHERNISLHVGSR